MDHRNVCQSTSSHLSDDFIYASLSHRFEDRWQRSHNWPRIRRMIERRNDHDHALIVAKRANLSWANSDLVRWTTIDLGTVSRFGSHETRAFSTLNWFPVAFLFAGQLLRRKPAQKPGNDGDSWDPSYAAKSTDLASVIIKNSARVTLYVLILRPTSRSIS